MNAWFLVWSHSSLTEKAKQKLFPIYLDFRKRQYYFFNIENVLKLNEIVDAKMCLMQYIFISEVFIFPDLLKIIAKEIFVCLVMHDSFSVNSFYSYLWKSVKFLHKDFHFFIIVCAQRRESKGSQLGLGRRHHCVSLIVLQQGRLAQAQSSETQRPVGY